MKLGVVVVMLALGCGNPPPPRPPISSTPAPVTTTVHGWWHVEDDKRAADVRNARLKLSPGELAIVLPDGRVMVRECPVVATGNTGTITGCNGNATLTLTGDTLDFDAGPHEHFTAARIPTGEVAALEASLAKQRPPADACPRARACYRAAMTALGEKGDEEQEFKYAPGATDCINTVKGLVMLLDEKHAPVPAACQGITR